MSLTNSRQFKDNCVCEYCVQKKTQDSSAVCDIDFGLEINSEWPVGLLNTCSDFYQFYNVNEHRSVCCKDRAGSSLYTTIQSVRQARRNTDAFILNAAAIQTKQYLHKLSLQKTKHLPNLEDISNSYTKFSDISAGNITGLKCRTNRTVDFYYLDSVYHSVFVRELNIPVPKQSSKVAVILVDLKDEAVYVMKEKLNYNSLGKPLRTTVKPVSPVTYTKQPPA